MALEKIRRGELYRPPPVRLVVLFFSTLIEFIFLLIKCVSKKTRIKMKKKFEV